MISIDFVPMRNDGLTGQWRSWSRSMDPDQDALARINKRAQSY